jgi:hypothetical protein
VPRLLAEIDSLRRDRERADAMRAASARLGQPGAAADIAQLIAGLVPAALPPAASMPRASASGWERAGAADRAGAAGVW